MTRDEIRAVLKRHLEAEDRHDAKAAAAVYTPDGYYEHVSLGARFEGREGVEGQYAAAFAGLPDSVATVERELFAENRVVHWGRIRGTVTGPFLGQQPTGKPVEFDFVAVYEFRDGGIAGEVVYYDLEEVCASAGFSLDAVRATGRAMAASLAQARAAS